MSDQAASINFDRIAPIYEESRGGLARGGAYARTIGAHLRPGLVLEIGIGTGSVALPLTDAGHPVVGVDISRNMLAAAHDRLGSRVAIADVMALPIATGSVTNVVAVWVFQLVGSVETTLREARRALSVRWTARRDPVTGDPRSTTTSMPSPSTSTRCSTAHDPTIPNA